MVAVLIRKKLKTFSWAEGVNAFKVKFSDVDFFSDHRFIENCISIFDTHFGPQNLRHEFFGPVDCRFHNLVSIPGCQDYPYQQR